MLQGGETIYAQFEIWKENAIWGDQSAASAFAAAGRRDSAYPGEDPLLVAPPPYPSFGRYGSAGTQQQPSYTDMSYVLQVYIVYTLNQACVWL
jgi:hypothetical protein